MDLFKTMPKLNKDIKNCVELQRENPSAGDP